MSDNNFIKQKADVVVFVKPTMRFDIILRIEIQENLFLRLIHILIWISYIKLVPAYIISMGL